MEILGISLQRGAEYAPGSRADAMRAIGGCRRGRGALTISQYSHTASLADETALGEAAGILKAEKDSDGRRRRGQESGDSFEHLGSRNWGRRTADHILAEISANIFFVISCFGRLRAPFLCCELRAIGTLRFCRNKNPVRSAVQTSPKCDGRIRACFSARDAFP